jgi:hypothetical protein
MEYHIANVLNNILNIEIAIQELLVQLDARLTTSLCMKVTVAQSKEGQTGRSNSQRTE